MGPLFLIFIAMMVAFVGAVFFLRLPIGLAMILASLVGALLGGFGLPLRHFIEGSFVYLDAILIIATAMMFMKVLEAAGLLDHIAYTLISRFYRYRFLLFLSMVFLVMFPGMLTGSSTAAVLTGGALVAPVLMELKLDRIRTAALIAMAGIFGMIAPPVNIPVMIIGGGVDMPYVGFTPALLFFSLTLAILSLFLICGRLAFGRGEPIETSLKPLKTGFWGYSPLILVVALMAGEKILPAFPHLGLPLIFSLGALLGLFTGRRFQPLPVLVRAMGEVLPVLGILVGVGVFIQIMTLTGVRGFLVVSAISLPALLIYLGLFVSMPLFGAVSSYGSASVLGIPFLLAFLGGQEILIGAALSLLAGLGDLMPPTALAGMFAAQVVKAKKYGPVLKYCLLPALITGLLGIGAIAYASVLWPLLGQWYFWLLLLGVLLLCVFLAEVLVRKEKEREKPAC